MIEKNKIYNMDCLEGLKQINDNTIDLTVTSPPYDNLRDYKGYSFNFEEIAKQLFRVTKTGGVVVWIVGDETVEGNESGTSFKQALFFKNIGFNLFDTMIYEKTRGACGNNTTYWQSFEYMFVLSKGKPKTINLICDRKNNGVANSGISNKRHKSGKLIQIHRNGYGEYGRRTNIWSYCVGGNDERHGNIIEHPAIFPERLARDHILSWSNEGDLILDPFMGSGTTAFICKKFRRNYIGFEISSEYCKIAIDRLNLPESYPTKKNFGGMFG